MLFLQNQDNQQELHISGIHSHRKNIYFNILFLNSANVLMYNKMF